MKTLEQSTAGLEVGSYRYYVVLDTTCVVDALQARGYDSEITNYVVVAVNEYYYGHKVDDHSVVISAIFDLVRWVGKDLRDGSYTYKSAYDVVEAIREFECRETRVIRELKLALEYTARWNLPVASALGYRTLTAIMGLVTPTRVISTPATAGKARSGQLNPNRYRYFYDLYTDLVCDALQAVGVPEDDDIIKLVRFAVLYCVEYDTHTLGHYSYRALYELVHVVGEHLLESRTPACDYYDEAIREVGNYLQDEGCDETYIMRVVHEIRSACWVTEGSLRDDTIKKVVSLMRTDVELTDRCTVNAE